MRPYFKDKVISNQNRDGSERIKSKNKRRSLILQSVSLAEAPVHFTRGKGES